MTKVTLVVELDSCNYLLKDLCKIIQSNLQSMGGNYHPEDPRFKVGRDAEITTFKKFKPQF